MRQFHRWRLLATLLIGRLAHLTDRAGRWGGIAAPDPTAADILAQYPQGWVLFGRPGTRRAQFEWRWYPRRAVITAQSAKIPRRLRPVLNRRELEIRLDHDADAIIEGCRAGRGGWLTEAAAEKYREVARLGGIGTVGAYRDGRLVAGLWGITFGRVLGIMSMFHDEDHAGSVVMAALVEEVRAGGRWSVVDCGGLSETFRRFGAVEIPTGDFSLLAVTQVSRFPASAWMPSGPSPAVS